MSVRAVCGAGLADRRQKRYSGWRQWSSEHASQKSIKTHPSHEYRPVTGHQATYLANTVREVYALISPIDDSNAKDACLALHKTPIISIALSQCMHNHLCMCHLPPTGHQICENPVRIKLIPDPSQGLQILDGIPSEYVLAFIRIIEIYPG